jgi:CRP-like cAMP-binding protein
MDDSHGSSPQVRPNIVEVDADKYLAFVTSLELFHGVSRDAVKHVLKRGQVLEYPERATIFHEGQPGEHVYLLLKGRVGIFVKKELVALCRAGQSFGELSPIAGELRSATAVAEKDALVLALSVKALESLSRDGFAVRFLINVIHECHKMLQTTNAEVTRVRQRLEDLEAK